ncbi:aldo/keto reductase [Demequina flava]|uniref:aldo/keto reductase n=1 Tax=Demequina flava TaxID=1095025 RepID=UPI000783D0BD|nr:aldo/keto reductase [Demequina flava]
MTSTPLFPTRSVRGLTMTELGLGAAQLGNLYRETTDREAADTVQVAWDSGIRMFDTAPHYGLGLSEKRLGALLRDHPRDEYLLSTKVGRLLEPTPESVSAQDDGGFAVPAWARRELDYSRDGVLRSIEESLERLGTDRIDIAYLHDPDVSGQFDLACSEGIGALIELRDQGVLRAVGGGMNDAAPLAELVRRADVDLVMCAGRLTLLDQSALDDLAPLALERGVGIVAAGVYNAGLLSRPWPPSDAMYDYEPASVELIERARRIATHCESHGVTLPDVAIAYSLSHTAVCCAVIGARGQSQTQSTVDRYNTQVPPELWDDLVADELIPPFATHSKGRS